MTITYNIQVPCVIEGDVIKCKRLDVVVKGTPSLIEIVKEKSRLNCVGCPIFAISQYARMLLSRSFTRGKARIEIVEGKKKIYIKIQEKEA